MNKLQIFNDKMIELSLLLNNVGIPCGFTVSLLGHFKLHFSKQLQYRAFDSFEDLVDYVIQFKIK